MIGVVLIFSPKIINQNDIAKPYATCFTDRLTRLSKASPLSL